MEVACNFETLWNIKYKTARFHRQREHKNIYVYCMLFKGEFRPRQTRQLPRAVDLKGRLLSCQRY